MNKTFFPPVIVLLLIHISLSANQLTDAGKTNIPFIENQGLQSSQTRVCLCKTNIPFIENHGLQSSQTRVCLCKTDIPFIENHGQFNKDIRFGVNTFGGNLYVTEKGELIYTLTNKEKEQPVIFKENFVTGTEPFLRGESLTHTKVNYFIGSDKTKWQSNIPAYESVSLGQLFAGIEVRLRAHCDNVEKLFYLKPYANINNIKIAFSEVSSAEISQSGELILTTPTGKASFTKPVAYQTDDKGDIEYVAVSYTLKGNCYGFSTGEYDNARELVIDPLLSSTFIGGSSADDDYGPSLQIDNEGYIYLCGYTSSSDFPSFNGYDPAYNGGKDIFVCKFSSDLSTLLVSTFIGGSGNDFEATMCFDAERENLFISGYTSSTDFPVTENAFAAANNGGSDCYLLKINKDLSDLQASTYFGGSANEGQQWPKLDIALGQSGNIYIAGLTCSPDFPVLQGISQDSTYAGGTNGGDAFAAKFDGNLSSLLAATYIGGSFNEWRMSIGIDSEENIFVCGETESGDFSFTPAAYDSSFNGASDIFICKYDNSLSELISATCLGRNNFEEPLDLAIDTDNKIFISGYTKSSNFPTTAGSYDHVFSGGDRDGYIASFSNDLSDLISSTFLGGNLRDDVTTISIDAAGLIYAGGNTSSTNFPTTLNTFDFTYNGGSDYGDAFVSVLSNDLTQLHASTYIGGNLDDRALDIALNPESNIVIAGYSKSAGFPVTAQAYDSLNTDSYCDCFISVFTQDLTGNIVATEPENELQNSAGTDFGCYPNPFNAHATIRFTLLHESKVKMDIYNIKGSCISTLIDNYLTPGFHSATFDGNNLPSGIYFIRLITEERELYKKIILLK